MIRKTTAFLLALIILMLLSSPALAVRYYRVNTSWLKAHEKPEYSSTVLDSYRRDFAVTIAQKYSGGWAKVRFRPGGAAVFVQTKYLKLCSIGCKLTQNRLHAKPLRPLPYKPSTLLGIFLQESPSRPLYFQNTPRCLPEERLQIS